MGAEFFGFASLGRKKFGRPTFGRLTSKIRQSSPGLTLRWPNFRRSGRPNVCRPNVFRQNGAGAVFFLQVFPDNLWPRLDVIKPFRIIYTFWLESFCPRLTFASVPFQRTSLAKALSAKHQLTIKVLLNWSQAIANRRSSASDPNSSWQITFLWIVLSQPWVRYNKPFSLVIIKLSFISYCVRHRLVWYLWIRFGD